MSDIALINPVSILDLATLTWSLLNDSDSNSTEMVPVVLSGRFGHSAVVNLVRDSIIIWGGQSSVDKPPNDTSIWIFNSTNRLWLNINGIGTAPPEARSHHSSSVVNGRMYVIGGIRESAGSVSVVYGGLYALDLRTWSWINLSPATSTAAGAFTQAPMRQRHAAVVFSTTIFINGGRDVDSNYLSTTICYDVIRSMCCCCCCCCCCC